MQQQNQHQQLHHQNVQHQTVPNAPQTGQIVIAFPQKPSLNVEAIRGLAITQIMFGVIAFGLGIAAIPVTSYMYWVSQTGSGIWYGVWILITGIIGLLSARKPFSRCLNGTNMAFNIACLVVSLLVGTFCAIAISYFRHCTEIRLASYYRLVSYSRRNVITVSHERILHTTGSLVCMNKQAGVAIYSVLLVLMIAEFVISLTISILCYQCACCSTGCCGQTPTGSARQQPVGYDNTASNTSGQVEIATKAGYSHAVHNRELPTSSSYASGFKAYPTPNQMIVDNSGMVGPASSVIPQRHAKN